MENPLLQASGPDAVPVVKAPRNYEVLTYARQALALFVATFIAHMFAVMTFCGRGTLSFYGAMSGPSSWGSCSPMGMAAARNSLVTIALLPVIWFCGEFVIKRFVYVVADEVTTGKAWQGQLDAADRAAGRTPPSARQPRHDAAWDQQIAAWQSNRASSATTHKVGTRRRAAVFCALFFVAAYVDVLLVLAVSPTKDTSDETFVWRMQHALGFTDSGLYSMLLLLVVLLEVVLFMAAVVCVKWPAKHPPLSQDRFVVGVQAPQQTNAGAASMFASAEEQALTMSYPNVTPGLIPDVALLIACHESTIHPDRVQTFSETLRAALRLFPPGMIFVCDNGGSPTPVDRTEEVCRSVSAEFYGVDGATVQYLYIPEGNKSHAMYWTTEYFIPKLVETGQIAQEPQYALLIDDDVPLPPDLQVPLATLNASPNIQAVSYAIQAATESGRWNLLVDLQDAEYKVAGAMKQLQARMGSTLYCHGAIGLWRRDILGKKILWDHDTVFHGEDLYMGLLLHRLRRGYSIAMSAEAVVPTYAPETLKMLFKQRTRSWDLCTQRKVYSLFKEFLLGWCSGRQALALKPFLFYEVIAVFLDWMRLFLFVGLVIQDPASLVVLIIIFWGLQWALMALFNFVILRGRPDLRIGVLAFFLFPAYKAMGAFFRIYALLSNIIVYSTWQKKRIPISARDRGKGDLPPVPNAAAGVDWWTVFLPSAGGQGAAGAGASAGTGAFRSPQQHAPGGAAASPPQQQPQPQAQARPPTFRSVIENMLADAPARERGDVRRVVPVLEAYTVYRQLTRENTRVRFPALLAAPGADAAAGVRAASVGHALTAATEAFEVFLGIALHAEWPRVLNRVDACVQSTSTPLFATPDVLAAVDGRDASAAQRCVVGNQRVLTHVRGLLSEAAYPAQQDKLAVIKQRLAEVMDMLQEA